MEQIFSNVGIITNHIYTINISELDSEYFKLEGGGRNILPIFNLFINNMNIKTSYHDLQ